MFADTRLVNLFPVPLWVHALNPEDAASVNEPVLTAIERVRAEKSGLGPNESWQTDSNLQDDPAFAGLTGFIRGATDGVLGYLGVRQGSFTITDLWADVAPSGGAPRPARGNPNNFLSGLYYVRAPQGGNSIVFYDPKPESNNPPQFSEPNQHNSRSANIDVQEGALILFPAWLQYSAEQNNGDRERISIGFNIEFV